jgi:hypothetical protein
VTLQLLHILLLRSSCLKHPVPKILQCNCCFLLSHLFFLMEFQSRKKIIFKIQNCFLPARFEGYSFCFVVVVVVVVVVIGRPARSPPEAHPRSARGPPEARPRPARGPPEACPRCTKTLHRTALELPSPMPSIWLAGKDWKDFRSCSTVVLLPSSRKGSIIFFNHIY